MLSTQTKHNTDMAKTKIKREVHAFESEAEFREAVNRCVVLEAKKEVMKARKKERTAKLAECFDAKIAPLEQEITQLLDDCRRYADEHPEMLKKGTRSGETEAAVYGYRLGNHAAKLIKGRSWKPVVEAITQKGKEWMDALFAKKEPEVSKEAVLAAWRAGKTAAETPAPAEEESKVFSLSEQQLTELGVRIEQEDSFYIEPKDKEAEK